MLTQRLAKLYEQKGNETDTLCVLWIEDSSIWAEGMGKEAFDSAYSDLKRRYQEGTLTELCALRPNLNKGALLADSPEIVRVQSYDGLVRTIASRRFDLVIADLNIYEVDPEDYDPEADRSKYCPPVKLAELLEPLNFHVPVLLMTSGGRPNSGNAKALRAIEEKFEAYTGTALRDKLLFLKDNNEPYEKLQGSFFDLLLIALRRDWQSFLDEHAPLRQRKALQPDTLPIVDMDSQEPKEDPSWVSRLFSRFKAFTG